MEKYLELLKSLPKDVQKQAKACKSKEEFLELLKANGIDVPDVNGTVELSDEDLDKVAGGCWESNGDSGYDVIVN